jgi:hypothetical protein
MKINLGTIDKTQFLITENTVNGEKLFLVQPQQIGCTWTQENKIFRSSIWNEQGELVSASFPKFVNWGENPITFPVPDSLENCVVTEKLDGSLLIVSKYKGEIIFRTRGTFDAFKLPNGLELAYFFSKYPWIEKILKNSEETISKSYLFEWVSPTNKIILNYGSEPDWYLIGVVEHFNYSLATQADLDLLAKIFNCKRPNKFTFIGKNSLLDEVSLWKGKEGVCVYSNNDQTIHKVKSTWYLTLHRLKSEINNMTKLLDVYLSKDKPTYGDFKRFLIDSFDYELFTQIEADVNKLYDAKEKADNIIAKINDNCIDWAKLPRKEAALIIIDTYGEGVLKGIAFVLLNRKPIEDKMYKMLILEQLS